MHSIEVLEKNESKKLYQWDTERYVSITAPKGVEVDAVDFAHGKETQAIRKKIVNEDGALKAKIPNTLLQSDEKIKVWLMCGEQTVSGRNLVVLPKAKSPDYILPDDEDEVRSYISLEERIAALEKNSNKKESDLIYNVKNYGISTEAEDNTPAMQALVDLVCENGGGTIYFPIGTYVFKKTDVAADDANKSEYSILMKSNVSIAGENLRQTILKQVDGTPYSLFYHHGTPEAPITGCTYSNFTVDAYDTGNINAVYGKAFYYQYVRDCIFRDILLRGTVATALGIDYLDRVLINNVNCVDCGRTYSGAEGGTSGIGIGTGGWENENFLIQSCICKGSGQYGIFIENQYNLGWGGTTDFSKGCIISNCIVRDGLNKGIGIKGGQNVTVIGCEVYENAADGVFVDGKCKNVRVASCNSANNQGNGIKVATQESEKIILRGNMIDSNALNGILLTPVDALTDMVIRDNDITDNSQSGIDVAADIDSFVLMGNYAKGNEKALDIEKYTYADAVIGNNVLLDGVVNAGIYIGNTDFNELLDSTETFKTITVSNEDFTQGYKLSSEGAETANEASGVSRYLDVSGVSKIKIRYSIIDLSNGAAIVEFDGNKTFVKRTVQFDNTLTEPIKTNYDVVVELDSATKYIKISVNELNDTYCTVEEY